MLSPRIAVVLSLALGACGPSQRTGVIDAHGPGNEPPSFAPGWMVTADFPPHETITVTVNYDVNARLDDLMIHDATLNQEVGGDVRKAIRRVLPPIDRVHTLQFTGWRYQAGPSGGSAWQQLAGFRTPLDDHSFMVSFGDVYAMKAVVSWSP